MEPAAFTLCVCHTRFSGVWQKAAGAAAAMHAMEIIIFLKIFIFNIMLYNIFKFRMYYLAA
jgi:hypothetical protein